MEKQFPYSLEAEQGLLGSVLIDPEALAQVIDVVHAEDFYRDEHRIIFETIVRLNDARTPADFITLCEALDRAGQLEAAGGGSTITSLANEVPTSGNVLHYAGIVAQKALLRRLIHAGSEIVGLAYEESEEALEQAEKIIFGLHQQQSEGRSLSHVSEIMNSCMAHLDLLHDRKADIIGVPSGFHDLDMVLSGLQPSDLIILAARPRVGKTSLALNIARNASEVGKRTAIFSLEMSREQLGLRLIAMQTRIDQARLRKGWVHDEEWTQIVTAVGELSDGSIWIDDTAAISLASMRSRARQLQMTSGLDLIVVDYLQLMKSGVEKRNANREQEIAEISRGLKALAKELNVPVLALAQLSRGVEQRQDKIPLLSDLRESGAIENDADVVMFIHRESLYNPETENPNTADLIIAKHRNGPAGTIRLGFEATQTRFYDLLVSPMEEEE